MTYPPPEYPVVPRTVRTCRARWTSDDRSQERAESEQSGVGTGTSWQQILLGHLEVLDRSDRDGRGYLVLRRVQSSAKGTLTLRQRRALTLRAAGHAYKFIAYELGISNSTASLDVAEGMAKLGLRSVLELVCCLGEGERTSSGVSALTLEHEVPGTTSLMLVSFAIPQPSFPVSWHSRLTHSEISVLRDFLRGSTDQEIAMHQGKSRHTVRNQRASIYQKLGVSGRLDLVRLSARWGSTEGIAPAVSPNASYLNRELTR